MKAIVVNDQAAGLAGMKQVTLPEPQPAINDVIVQVYATNITGHELSGMVTALGYGATGLSI